MKSGARAGLQLLGVVFALALLSYAALFLLVRSPSFRAWSQEELSRRTGLQIRFAELTMHFPLQLVAKALEVSRPGEFALESARVGLTIAPLDLWFRTVHRINAEQPRLTIDLLGITKPPESTSAAIGIRHAKLQQGSIVLKRGDATVFQLPNIDLEARDLNMGPELGLRLRADLPLFDAETDVHVTGAPGALKSEIVVRPSSAASLVRKSGGGGKPDWLSLRAHVELPSGQAPKGSIVGSFTNLPVRAGNVSGDVDVRGTIDEAWEKFLFSGRAAIRDMTAALGPIGDNFPQGGASADFTGSFSLTDMTLALESAAIDSPLGKGTGGAVAVFAGGAEVRSAELSWSALPLALLDPLLPARFGAWKFAGSAEIALRARGPWNDLEIEGEARSAGAGMQGDRWSIPKLSFVLPFSWSDGKGRMDKANIAATGVAYAAKDQWQAAAERARAIARMEFSRQGLLKFSAAIEAGGGKFQSPDAARVGENLSVSGPVAIMPLPGRDAFHVNADLTIDSGDVLWDKFFTDLKLSRPRMSFDGEYARAQNRLECRRADIMLADAGAVSLEGFIEGFSETPRLEIRARSEKFQPGVFFDALLRENLKRQYPFVEELLLRGTTAFQVRLTGSGEDLALAGDLSLDQGVIASRSGSWEIGGIALDLPVAIAWGKAAGSMEKLRAGSLVIGQIRFAGRDARIAPAALSLFQNELRFHGPLRAAIFGGEIVLGELRWPDLIRQPRQLTFSLAAERVQLEDLTGALGWPRFRGTLTGSIPQIQSAGSTLKTNGEIRAEVFGGRVGISKLEIENPFSALAAIRLDAALANIDLEQLSRTFEFGRISGTLEGTVADLIIIDGQPAQFGADLHSVDRGGEQRISVEALNKITVLSSGQSAGALYGGLAGLFDSFRYSKLGFKAILRNDRLVLRGVETRGGQEYLVVGSILPPTVNIVSHTQTIGFSELLRRLERIRTEQPKVQ